MDRLRACCFPLFGWCEGGKIISFEVFGSSKVSDAFRMNDVAIRRRGAKEATFASKLRFNKVDKNVKTRIRSDLGRLKVIAVLKK